MLNLLDKISRTILFSFVVIIPLVFLARIADFSVLFNHAFTIFGVSKEFFARIMTWLLLMIILFQATFFKKPFMKHRIFFLFLIFIIYQALSLTWAHNRWQGFEHWTHWISLFMFLFVCIQILRNTNDIQTIIKISLVPAALVCILSMLHYYADIDFPFFHNRIFKGAATFGNPKFAAEYLAPLIFWALGLCTLKLKLWERGLYVFVVVLIFSSITFIYHSRAAVMGVILCVPLATLIYGLKPSLSFFRKKYVLIMLLLLLTIWGLMFTQYLKNKPLSARINHLLQTSSGTHHQRVVIWKNTLNIVKDHFWLGVGLGNFNTTYPYYTSPQDRFHLPIDTYWNHFIRQAHNEYLQIFAELGIIGLLLAFFIFVYICHTFYAYMRQQPQRDHLTIFIFLSFLCSCVIAFFSFSIQNPASSFFLMITIACLMKITMPASNTRHKTRLFLPRTISFALLCVALLSPYLLGQKLMARLYQYQAKYKKSLKWQPHNWETHFWIGKAYYDHSLYPKAITHFEKALVLNPSHVGLYYNLGLSYEAAKQTERAKAIYKRLLKMAPDFRMANLKMGYLAMNQKNCEEAKQYFHAVLMPAAYQESTLKDAWHGLALCGAREGNSERAFKDLFESFLANPNDTSHVKTLMNNWFNIKP